MATGGDWCPGRGFWVFFSRQVMLVFEPSSFEPEEFFKGSGQGQEPSFFWERNPLGVGGCCDIHFVGKLLRLQTGSV